jgi:hypothetical protein
MSMVEPSRDPQARTCAFCHKPIANDEDRCRMTTSITTARALTRCSATFRKVDRADS